MSERVAMPAGEPVRLKSYKGPWKGQLLLACGKCQRKLKGDDDEHGLGKLKKALKQRAKKDATGLQFMVVRTQCLKVCPKRGVAVCTQAQTGLGQCSIVRTGADLDLLYAECKADALGEERTQLRGIGEGKKKRQTR